MASMNSLDVKAIGLQVSWQASCLAWKDEAGVLQQRHHEMMQSLPELPDVPRALSKVILPLECFLVRHVSLPFNHLKLVDAEMLFQLLADSSDIDAEDYWISWDLRRCEGGLAGMVFGLPESLRKSIQSHSQWAKAEQIMIDGYERLQLIYTKTVDADVANKGCLLLDQDAEGMFFGVHDGECWRGMRRLNGEVNQQGFWQQLKYSATAMGFSLQSDCVLGQVDEHVISLIEADDMNWQGELADVIVSRHEVNLNRLADLDRKQAELNLRHSSWAAVQGWGQWRVWRRSVVLAAVLLLSWMASVGVELNRMNTEISSYTQRIEAAFHQGLPNETVMLDALAQLRKAAGGGQAHDASFLISLQAVSQVYQTKPWLLNVLELRDGKTYMAGKVDDIKGLNEMQRLLKKVMQKNVRITDTNMSGEEVHFRMQW